MPAPKSGKKKGTSRKKIRVVKQTSAAKKTKRSAPKVVLSTSKRSKPSIRDNSTRRTARTAKAKASQKRTKAPTTQKKSRPKVRLLTDVPGWNDLITEDNRRLVAEKEAPSFLGTISTVRFTLGVLAVACIFTLYVGHVYATQDLLSAVQVERKENLRLQLEYNRAKGIYDAAIGPAVIHQRAKALGLQEKMISGPPVLLASQ